MFDVTTALGSSEQGGPVLPPPHLPQMDAQFSYPQGRPKGDDPWQWVYPASLSPFHLTRGHSGVEMDPGVPWVLVRS